MASWENPQDLVVGKEKLEALSLASSLSVGKDWLGAEFRVYGLVGHLTSEVGRAWCLSFHCLSTRATYILTPRDQATATTILLPQDTKATSLLDLGVLSQPQHL